MNRTAILALVGAAGLAWFVLRGRSAPVVEAPETEPSPDPGVLPWWATSPEEIAAYQRLRASATVRPSLRPPADRPPACATCS